MDGNVYTHFNLVDELMIYSGLEIQKCSGGDINW